MNIVGVDPGLSGALAFFVDGKLGGVEDMPVMPRLVGKGNQVNVSELRELLHGWVTAGNPPCAAYLEYVNAMPGGGTRKMGASSAFAFGHSVGSVRGVLAGLNIPVHEIPPARWKSQFGLLRKEKDVARTAATERWPAFSSRFAPKVRGVNRADAALIGCYGTMEDIFR